MGAVLEIGLCRDASINVAVTHEGSWGSAVLHYDQTVNPVLCYTVHTLTCSAPPKERRWFKSLLPWHFTWKWMSDAICRKNIMWTLLLWLFCTLDQFLIYTRNLTKSYFPLQWERLSWTDFKGKTSERVVLNLHFSFTYRFIQLWMMGGNCKCNGMSISGKAQVLGLFEWW